jgi:hypothetical protein
LENEEVQKLYITPGWRLALILGASLLSLCAGTISSADEAAAISAPAVPLIARDPYFSIWSTGHRLTDVPTTHWTGKPQPVVGLVTIDGVPFRFLGSEPNSVPALDQVNSQITPTQSVFGFAGGGIELRLAFVTPALPSNIDVLSRPIVYVTFTAHSTDGKSHDVKILFQASAELTVNTPQQSVGGNSLHAGELVALKLGSLDQAVLETKGDDVRIDWGYLYLAAPKDQASFYSIGAPKAQRESFVAGKALPEVASKAPPADQLAAAIVLSLPKVGAEEASRWVIVAYDDLESIEYMGSQLKPYWRRNGLDAEGLLTESARDREKLIAACNQFDRELTADLIKAGGDEYAAIATLAYRQCFAAGKFVADANGQPLQFCKENHSNGCISTSDVFYPMSPQFLLFGPTLAKSFVVPFMNYAASDRWQFPFAPHDLGTYPMANGQVYGGGERTEEDQMPVEESGNLLILLAAIAKLDGNADFAGHYWPQLEQWAKYLKQEGFDPANQLCTDDFAGHLAHNVNLSAKAICGLGAFAQLCQMRGDTAQAAEYRHVAEEFAARWVKEADDGDHFRLAFDKPGTWSQKYNLVWDRVLGLNLFPQAVLDKEMAYYRKAQNRYGLPLDNRKSYTKLDWTLWTATLTQNRDDFTVLVHPVLEFLQNTPDRSPMTDWYETESGKKVGFTARPVVGGVFMQLLNDPKVWQKWAERDLTKAQDFAPMPHPPKVTNLVPAADSSPTNWRFTTEPPRGLWYGPDFDDSKWQRGPSGFGTAGTPGARIGTTWNSPDIWLRRKFDLPDAPSDSLRLHIHHDEDAEVYINGVLARRIGGFDSDYEQLRISPEALQTLKPQENSLAVHCRQTVGGQYIDVGISSVEVTAK